MLNKKIGAFCFVIFALVVFLFSTVNSKSLPVVKEWRIPVLLFLSGPVAGDAIVHKWLMDETAKDINAAGGVNGKPIVLEYFDTGWDPSKTTAAMAKAIDMKAICTLGPFSDFELKSAMPLAVREGIFSFAGAGNLEVAKEFQPWTLYTLQNNYEIQEMSMPQWLKKEPDIKNVVAFVEPLAPSLIEFAKGCEKSLIKLGKKSTIIEIPIMKVDYSASVVKALSSGADAFAFWTAQQSAAKIIKELVRRNIKGKKMWLSGMSTGQSFFNEAGKAAEGVYAFEAMNYDFTSKYAEYNKRYTKENPGKYLSTFTYVTGDMVTLVKNAIEATGITGDPAKLKEERGKLRDYAINQKGVQGLKYKYDVVKGIGQHVPLMLFQIRDGKEVLVDKIVP